MYGKDGQTLTLLGPLAPHTANECEVYHKTIDGLDDEEFDNARCQDESGVGLTLRKHHYRVAALPHSCDNWVIGGATEVQMLIADLQHALKMLSDKTPGESVEENP